MKYTNIISVRFVNERADADPDHNECNMIFATVARNHDELFALIENAVSEWRTSKEYIESFDLMCDDNYADFPATDLERAVFRVNLADVYNYMPNTLAAKHGFSTKSVIDYTSTSTLQLF